MKSLFVSFFLTVFLITNSNAQKVLETPLFEKVKLEGRLLYHKKNVSCYMSPTAGPRATPLYTFLDFETGEIETRECGEIKSDNGSGYILAVSVKDDYFYELIEYGGTGFTTKCYVGVIKRDVKTMQPVATFDLGKFGIFNSGERPNITMYKADDGIFFVAGKQGYGEQRNFVSKVDFDLNLLWQNDFDYFSEDGISLGKSIVQGNSLITQITVDVEIDSKRKFNLFGKEFKTGLLLLSHETNGENKVFAPTLEKDHIVLGSKFFYDEKKKEFAGFFLTIKEYSDDLRKDNQGVGYAFYRWDDEGNVKQSTIDHFTLQDLLSISNLEEYMEKADLEMSSITRKGDLKGLLNINRGGFKVDFLENGEVIVRVNSYKIGELKKGIKYADLNNSFFLFSLNADGSKKWVQLFPMSSHQHGADASQIRGDRLLMYTSEYIDNFADGKYTLNNIAGFSTWKTIVPAIRSVNLNDGSVDYYEPITTDVHKKLEIRLIDINKYDDSEFGVIVTHSDFKRINWISRLYIPR